MPPLLTPVAGSPLERAQSALIRYPRFKEFHDEIRLCHELSRSAGEPQCMALEGLFGAGKSTLVKAYAESFPRVETPTGSQIPVLYLETPSPVTVKGMASAMLRHLGDPGAATGTLWSMDTRVIHFIKACGVQLVILDDFHHLYDSETDRILARVSDWLKVLIKETNVPFLVVGIEGKVEMILQANPQISRLFSAREQLKPLAWDATRPQTQQEFACFVEYLEQTIGLPLAKEVPRWELLYRLYYATDGVVGNIMKLTRNAAWWATQQGKKELDLTALSLEFQKRLQPHLRHKLNPFESPVTERFIPPTTASAFMPPDRDAKHGRRPRSPSVNAVLSRR